MPAVEVINLKNGDDVALFRQQRRLIRVTRPSIFSNPFSHLPDAKHVKFQVRTREEALDKYEAWIQTQPQLIEEAKRQLRGKVLGCWCLPDRCHAQVLAKIVNDAFPQDALIKPPPLPPSPEDLRAEASRTSPSTKIAPVPDAVVASALLGAYDPKAYGARCNECPLQGRHTPVPPAYAAGGPGSTKLIIVGEGPGRMEIATGKPFVGPSGQMVNKMLANSGMSRDQCHVTNAACCRGETDAEKERAAACCSARLSNELVTLDPAIPILALGAPAARVMLGKGSIMKTRGLVWKLPVIDDAKLRAGERSLEKRRASGLKKYAAAIDRSEQTLWRSQARAPLAGRICIPSIHPAFILRGGESHMPLLRVDVGRAVRWALGGPLKLLDDGPYKVAHTVDELRALLKTIRTEYVLIDVETLGPEPLIDHMTMLGISEVPDGTVVSDDDVRVVLASPPRENSGDRKRAQKTLREMGKVLNEFCKDRIVGGHNFASFDMLVLKRYGVKPQRIFDSLLAHHTFASHLRQGLDHLGSMYTDTGPWKVAFKLKGAEEKGGVQSKWMSTEDLDKYNCLRGSTRVVLADGSRRLLRDIVWGRESPLVMSMNAAGEIEPRRVTGWHQTRVEGQQWIGIHVNVRGSHSGPTIICTPDHRVYTTRGEVMAQDIVAGDRILQATQQLSDDERGALLGTLLGDSSMAFSPTNRARRRLARTAAVVGNHADYTRLAQHKCKVLPRLFDLAENTEMPGPGAYPNAAPTRRYCTAMRPEIAALRSLVYDEDGTKRLRASTITMLGPVGLAWWFMDDGCVQKNRVAADGVTLATNCFSVQDVQEAVGWFRQEFGSGAAGGDNVIRLSGRAAVAFCARIAPHVPSRFRYKFPRGAIYPAYSGTLRECLHPQHAEVLAVGPYATRRDSAIERFNADNRFCITVEGNHNFFTVGGLVRNCADVRINAVAWRRMQADLESEQSIYEGDLDRAGICRDMATAGFGFDQELAKELSAKLKARAGALLGQMRTLLSRPSFHPAKPQDLRAALFGQLKIRPLAITATGLASTASGTLEALKGETRAGKLADLILRWRATQKTRSTFILNIKPHKDGRVHPSWKAFGTVTGRFSCSRPNLMNLPRWSRSLENRVRELYVAAPGCVLIYFDLSQSEMRMAAYLSGDEAFIQSCESGDVHTSNAKILFPDALDVLTKDPKGKDCPRHGDEGDARSECKCGKPFRDVAKNAGFGILYQADSETIFKFLRSKGFEVTLFDVEAMFAQIHKVYARYYEFCNENWNYCKQNGHLREFFSKRIRWFGWFPSITDTANYPVQGGIAALMNARLSMIHPRLAQRGAVRGPDP